MTQLQCTTSHYGFSIVDYVEFLLMFHNSVLQIFSLFVATPSTLDASIHLLKIYMNEERLCHFSFVSIVPINNCICVAKESECLPF